MNILVVGGTGLTGAHAALYLQQQGHNVTVMSRSQPAEDHPVAGLPHIVGNYIADSDESSSENKAQALVKSMIGFDALVFAAGADIRQLPPGDDEDAFYHNANTVAIPRFVALAKSAGIKRVVYIGSYYPQVVPERIETSSYVRSRHLADEGIHALNDDNFSVCSLNAPFILGHVPGLSVSHLDALVFYALGQLEGLPLVAPAGGVNHISSESMSEAIMAALERGEPGKAYLVGDENLSWKQYLEMYFEAVGNPQDLPVITDEHPMFPDIMMYAGRNAEVYYEPDVAGLDYCRGRVRAAIEGIAASVIAAVAE